MLLAERLQLRRSWLSPEKVRPRPSFDNAPTGAAVVCPATFRSQPLTFDSLGLEAKLLRAIREQRYDAPTAVQQEAIPPILRGEDVLATAQTGTGKTASFRLPLLVFTRTKHGANKLARKLERADLTETAIHGNKSQNARRRALADFKRGMVRVLVVTDIAARGIDIDGLPHVVNFDLPNVAEDYVHRIGRTGRAGASGEAVSLA